MFIGMSFCLPIAYWEQRRLKTKKKADVLNDPLLSLVNSLRPPHPLSPNCPSPFSFSSPIEGLGRIHCISHIMYTGLQINLQKKTVACSDVLKSRTVQPKHEQCSWVKNWGRSQVAARRSEGEKCSSQAWGICRVKEGDFLRRVAIDS